MKHPSARLLKEPIVDDGKTNHFATIREWPSRWNGAEAVAGLTQSGPQVTATGWFGMVALDLRKKRGRGCCGGADPSVR